MVKKVEENHTKVLPWNIGALHDVVVRLGMVYRTPQDQKSKFTNQLLNNLR